MGSVSVAIAENLKEYISRCTQIPFTGKSIVNRKEVLDMLDELIEERKGDTNE